MIARRLMETPIIHPGLSARIGDNINGPSLIRVPDWVPEPLGRYYLYFAHHKGRFIRLAYANAVAGPWTIHQPGVLDVADSLFVVKDLDGADASGEWVQATGGDFLYAHVASPDVHVDDEHRTIRLYYHGLCVDGEQRTRLAVSADGLHFEPQEPLLGVPYYRVFQYDEAIYAIAWGGKVLRAKDWSGPFEAGPPILKPLAGEGMIIRHVAARCIGDQLDLFFTRIGDEPESILYARIDLAPDWNDWRVGTPTIVMSPELEWEGGLLPQTRSAIGAVDGPEHALRDPCIFTEGDSSYLLYCGSGEGAIGLAALEDS